MRNQTLEVATRASQVCVVDDWRELEALQGEWEELASDAVDLSPSAESAMLLPALRRGIQAEGVRVLIVHVLEGDARPQLCAVFPLEMRNSYRGLPFKHLRIWDHMYSLFPTPLIRKAYVDFSLAALLDWAATLKPTRRFIEFPLLRADSPFTSALLEALRARKYMYQISDISARACLKPALDAESYLAQVGNTHHRKEFRRLERRLCDMGSLTYDEYRSGDSNLSEWIDEFVRLEMSGWKGESGTAFGCNRAHRGFLQDIVIAAANQGRLMFLALRLNGRAVAMKLNFMSPPGSYAFKIAYDEKFAKYSPGILLELENIRRMHARKEVQWMDSLAVPDHPMINRLWMDRSTVLRLMISVPRTSSELAVSALPLLRGLKRAIGKFASGTAGGSDGFQK